MSSTLVTRTHKANVPRGIMAEFVIWRPQTHFLEMKNIFLTAFASCCILIGFSTSAFSQAKFLILVQTGKDNVTLTCTEGCAFKQISFSLKEGQKQEIDAYGMKSSGNAVSHMNGLPYFSFTMQRNGNGLAFEGLTGTAWTKLTFGCQPQGCNQYVDQYGMTDDHQK